MAMLEKLHIENNGIPIYVQIRDQILAAIGSGALKPGERLPTMREVAVALTVDLNTVRHAYDSAQEMGSIVLVRSRGTYVAEHLPEPDADARQKKIDFLAQQTIINVSAAGISLDEFIDCLTEIAEGQKAKGESK
jgi:GntR family transcriptional regulator